MTPQELMLQYAEASRKFDEARRAASQFNRDLCIGPFSVSIGIEVSEWEARRLGPFFRVACESAKEVTQSHLRELLSARERFDRWVSGEASGPFQEETCAVAGCADKGLHGHNDGAGAVTAEPGRD